MWDVLSGDYDKKTSPEKCLKNVIDFVRNGSIIVFHDSTKAQKNLEYALPRFIEYAIANGFEFGVLS
jgi:peptidoglycan/xylan/chitin deacetylase (PgdA/CDA1 family)